jgi:hypothetical protein
MVRFPFFLGMSSGWGDSFDDLPLVFGEFRPRLHSTFFAAWATFSVTHKLFFHDKLSYLLECAPRVT